MSIPKTREIELLKEKIQMRPFIHLDTIYDLIPENVKEAEIILSLMFELINEKRLSRFPIWKHMEEPLYFQESTYHDFSRRCPVIGKIARDGGLTLFNYYLLFKYGVTLSESLLDRNDVFIFALPPIKNYFDKSKWVTSANHLDKQKIEEKYYDLYGMVYELFGDIMQEKKGEILQRLIQCQFDLSSKRVIAHLKQYFHMNRFNSINIPNKNLQLLLDQGMDAEAFMDMVMLTLWDEFSLPSFAKGSSALIKITCYMLDHGSNLAHFSSEFMNEMVHLLEQHAKRLGTTSQQKFFPATLSNVKHLQTKLSSLAKVSAPSLSQAVPMYTVADGVRKVIKR